MYHIHQTLLSLSLPLLLLLLLFFALTDWLIRKWTTRNIHPGAADENEITRQEFILIADHGLVLSNK